MEFRKIEMGAIRRRVTPVTPVMGANMGDGKEESGPEVLSSSLPGAGEEIFIRPKQVIKMLGISLSTLYVYYKTRADFPVPMALNTRLLVWSKNEIVAWMEKVKRENRKIKSKEVSVSEPSKKAGDPLRRFVS
jgi:predicted DNA-binding transcriptional regulator AlpA